MNDPFNSLPKVSFSSSIKDDVWHPTRDSNGYEWWYFDAISDDGNAIIIVNFIENFELSRSSKENKTNAQAESINSDGDNSPLMSFRYFEDGKLRYRVVQKYDKDKFFADATNPECRIGGSSFKFKQAPYGVGFSVKIDLPLGKGNRLIGEFEWLAIESNLDQESIPPIKNQHWWNLSVPRADVTGRITIIGKGGIKRNEVNFRGTGYHDHNLDDRSFQETVSLCQRGRVHFPDSTAIFYRYRENQIEHSSTFLVVVREDNLERQAADYESANFRRNIFGLKYPREINFTDSASNKLRVTQNQPIESSIFYARFAAEYSLETSDGAVRTGIGVAEQFVPSFLRHSWLVNLSGFKLGR